MDGHMAGITTLDIGGGEAVAEEYYIFVFIGCTSKHIPCHSQTGFHICELVRIIPIPVTILINDVTGNCSHGIFQHFSLFRTGAGLQVKYLMTIGIESHIAHLADTHGVIGGEIVQKFIRRQHSCFVAGTVAEIRLHGIGNIHNDDHCHVRLLDDFINNLRGLDRQGDVKDVFNVRPGNGFADMDTVIFVGIFSTDIIDLLFGGRLVQHHGRSRRAGRPSGPVIGSGPGGTTAVFLEPAAVSQSDPVAAHAGLGNAVQILIRIRLQQTPHSVVQFQISIL